MITAERLEELIKQGATIYYINPNNYNGFYYWTSIKEIDLKNAQPYITVWNTEHGEEVEVTLKYDVLKELENGSHEILKYEQKVDLEFLFEENDIETKRAMWEKKTHATRTERFEPPMWDEIEDYSYRFVWQKQFILLDIHKDDDDESDMSYIHIYNFTDNGYIFYKIGDDATKENYIKACEIVRDLFNRGNK